MPTVSIYESKSKNISAVVAFHGKAVHVASSMKPFPFVVAAQWTLEHWNEFKKKYELEYITMIELDDEFSIDQVEKALDLSFKRIMEKAKNDDAEWKRY